MTAASNWSVVESDDDWQQYNPTSAASNSDTSTNDAFFVPVKIALLYKDIEQKRTLPLTCSCPRVGIRESNVATNSTLRPTPEMIEQQQHVESQKIVTDNIDTSKVYEAFEFDDESDKGPASAKRKTPASGVKRPKKEKATLSNVVNDIRRHKLLDDMEAKKPEIVAETPEPLNSK